MELSFTAEEQAFRDEVRAFLASDLPERLRRGARLTTGVFAEPDIAAEWQAILEAKGWLVYHWPQSAGGPGWTPIQRYIFEKECAEAQAPVLPGMGLRLVGPVIYSFGTEAQKARFLGPLRRGEHVWAQGFSEPGAGSDLASLQTRAVRDGDDYIVNGSKIWTTQAQYANWLFCLVRTDPDVKPQKGISFLLIDMASPGVSVRPILSASGDHEVNQVFLDDVRAPVAQRIGEEGQGWSIAKFLLENERGGACFAPALLADLARLGPLALGAAGPAEAAFRTDELARISLAAEALEIIELRNLSAMADGEDPGPLAGATKLLASEIRQDLEQFVQDCFGYGGLQLPRERPLYGPDAPAPVASEEAQAAAARYLNSRAWSIFGGTSEVQLNLIARTALNL